MARLDQAGLLARVTEVFNASPDESGQADLVCDKGLLFVVSDPKELKPAFKKAKKTPGYKWVVINRDDLFAANPLSLGSKAGIFDADGNMLKNADVPRKKV